MLILVNIKGQIWFHQLSSKIFIFKTKQDLWFLIAGQYFMYFYICFQFLKLQKMVTILN